jgi:hypothetical protein
VRDTPAPGTTSLQLRHSRPLRDRRATHTTGARPLEPYAGTWLSIVIDLTVAASGSIAALGGVHLTVLARRFVAPAALGGREAFGEPSAVHMFWVRERCQRRFGIRQRVDRAVVGDEQEAIEPAQERAVV